MPELTQENRLIQVKTPLGKDKLVLTSIRGGSTLSQPFAFDLEMVSEEETIDPTKIVGKQVSFKVAMPDDKFRFFNGMVWRFVEGRSEGWETSLRQYRAEVVPWFKLLSLNKDCRIFQDKTAPDIIEQVFKDQGFTDYKKQLKGTYQKLEFCVQWRESDYDFASRLMEENGIYYYFTHEESKHTLVIADHSGAYSTCDESKVKFFDAFDAQLPSQVSRWDHQYQMVSGKFEQTDYNFEEPATKLQTKSKTIVKLPAVKNIEVYDYPGGYGKVADGKAMADRRMEALEVAYDSVIGESNSPSFAAGGKFKLVEHPVKSEENKEYVLVNVRHEARDSVPMLAESDEEEPQIYQNSFACIPSKVVFRPSMMARRPEIIGPQPAKVVGPKNSEIHTDKYGRIKVQFPWDREAKGDEKSSCWMRVSQDWAGKNWGSFFLPRVGQEVLVEFLNGDPNRPIVTGRVYNAEQMPPFKLPDQKAQSGWRTQSTTKGDKSKFNELRFDDTADKEHIYLHGQKDFVRIVENIDALEVGYDKSKYDQGDTKLKVTGEKGDQLIDILKNRTVTIDKGNDSLEIKTKDQILKISKGNQTVTIKGDQKSDIGKTSSLKAGTKIELKVGGNSITIDQQGIKIVGTKVSVEGKLSAEVKAVTVDVKGSAMVKVKGGMVMIN